MEIKFDTDVEYEEAFRKIYTEESDAVFKVNQLKEVTAWKKIK
jgi:hypothetical protein